MMAITEHQQQKTLTVQASAQDAFDKIHQLNHETFLQEMPHVEKFLNYTRSF